MVYTRNEYPKLVKWIRLIPVPSNPPPIQTYINELKEANRSKMKISDGRKEQQKSTINQSCIITEPYPNIIGDYLKNHREVVGNFVYNTTTYYLKNKLYCLFLITFPTNTLGLVLN